MENSESKQITWEEIGLDEWANPNDEDEKKELEQDAQKYNLTTEQVAKIKLGVWKGTYRPAKYSDPRVLSLVTELANEINRDEAVVQLIEDFCGVKFKEHITVEQALSELPGLQEELERRAFEIVGGELRKVLPDSIIVDRSKMQKRKEEEFRE